MLSAVETFDPKVGKNSEFDLNFSETTIKFFNQNTY